MLFGKKDISEPAARTAARKETGRAASGVKKSKQKKTELLPGVSMLLLFRLTFAIILLVVSAVVKTSPAVVVVLQVLAAIAAGYDLVLKAVNDVVSSDFSKENLPVVLAVILSFFIGRGTEGVIVLLVLQAALILRDYAGGRTAAALISSISLPKGGVSVSSGDVITVDGVNSLVPADCVVTGGMGTADLSFITGDAAAVAAKPGVLLPGGSRCTGGQLRATVGRKPEDSVCASEADAISKGYDQDTPFVSKVWKILKFLPALMLAIAVIVVIVCAADANMGFTEGLRRGITIIAVSAPLTVMLSVPMSYLSAMTAARRVGCVVKNAADLDKASSVKTLVFDKTGTVTSMNYSVTEVKSDKLDSEMLLKVAAHAVSRSKSAESKAVVAAYDGVIDDGMIESFKEFPGRGIEAELEGVKVLFGTEAFLKDYDVIIPKFYPEDNSRFMAFNGQYAGQLVLSESINSEIYDTISSLGSLGVDRIAMVSSNSRESDRSVAGSLGIAEYFAECSQEEKIKHIAELKGKTDGKSALAYVGCGSDIGPLCRTADLSFALNCMDVGYVPEGADVYVLGNSVVGVPKTIAIARRSKMWLLLEIAVMLAVKLLVVVLAATGVAPAWFGLVLDVCVSLFVTIDTLRPSRFGVRKK